MSVGRPQTKVLGKPVTRLEDHPLVLGRGRYAADVSFPHQLHMRMVRSDYAHARIKSIDISAAKAHPGVFEVWTAADIPDLPVIELRDGFDPVLSRYCQTVLAKNTARYVGDPIAVVFAESPYAAEDAVDLVTVEVEELPPLMSASDAPRPFDAGHTTETQTMRKAYGDIDAAFRDAHLVVELDVSVGRHTGIALETRGSIGRYDEFRDVLELHGAAKVPHKNRELLARWLKIDLHSLHLVEGHTGGGFGVRGELYPEDMLVLMAAKRLGRPVKWIEDRRENLMCANHSRQQRHKIRAAVDAEGRVIGLDDEIFLDQGAYIRTHGNRVMDVTLAMLPGQYRLPAFRAVGHSRLTNKTPCGTYRAPGRTEGTFARERLFDAIAHKLGIDRVELRRRNLIPKEEMPFDRKIDCIGEEVIYDTGDYAGLLDKTLKAVGWDKMEADCKRRRAAGEAVGVGLSLFLEESGLGPFDGARITIDPSGAVEVVTGGASLGQGFETAMAQICAEALGVDYKRIRVVHGRTDRIEFGIGAHAQRATVMTGSATHAAALNIRAKALDMAAKMLQSPADTLDIVDGVVVRKNAEGGPSVSLGEVAVALGPNSRLRGEREPGLTAEGWHHSELMNYAYGIHVAQVKVDRETGGVTIEKYMVAIDVGRAVNPMMITGQTVGGFAQGMAGALLEEFTYNERGEPLAVTFADYLMPTAREVPKIDVLITEDAPSSRNELGLKGAGEAGVTGALGAIASAIDDAIGIPGAITQVPITPQRLKTILASAST